TGDFFMQRPTICKLCWVTTATAAALEQFFTQHQYNIQPTDINESIAFLGPENIVLEFYLTVNATPAELQFKHSCSNSFWEAFTQVLHLPQGKFHSDSAIFEAAQLAYVPPFAREQASAIQPISKATTPVITVGDIKGIIHSHSKWSDGTHSLAEMATAAKQQGFEYLVISDHSRTASYAGGLSIERLLAQQEEINALNQQLAPFTIFKSIESDILTDGSLDYPDEILATLDLVIASVHSGLSMSEDKAMQRLIKAIENPYTNILGHLTGRLLLSRAGYPIDHETIIDACAANGVAIELNAHPRRLDIDWKYIEYALKKNVLISINPDAHAIDGFNDVKYGVLVAQKALLPAAQNLSSFSLAQMQQFIQQQQTKRK
ncbi:MAG TPA: histidinol-phosphatase, partial [Chitinophagaceae bacterium]|nr:histidinol-phosphatase [Chitinophagaceae bacterium]